MSSDDKPTIGKMRCSQPNLQNIPIRTPEGRRIRSSFERQAAFANEVERGFAGKAKVLQKLAAKHGVTISGIHDSMTMEGEPEDVEAYFKEAQELLFPKFMDDFSRITADIHDKRTWEEMGSIVADMKQMVEGKEVEYIGISSTPFRLSEDFKGIEERMLASMGIPGEALFNSEYQQQPFEITDPCPDCKSQLLEHKHRPGEFQCSNPDCHWSSHYLKKSQAFAERYGGHVKFREMRKHAKQVSFTGIKLGTRTGRIQTGKPNMANEPKCAHGVPSREKCVVCEELKKNAE